VNCGDLVAPDTAILFLYYLMERVKVLASAVEGHGLK